MVYLIYISMSSAACLHVDISFFLQYIEINTPVSIHTGCADVQSIDDWIFCMRLFIPLRKSQFVWIELTNQAFRMDYGIN